MQRVYPGQIPPLRRDLHNIVFPVDLSNVQDLELVIQTLQNFVRRKIPVRFGLVPTASSPGSVAHLKIAHYLHETFGLASLVKYLEEVSVSSGFQIPNQ
jgi:UDP-glucose:glycoprotein glucosyltransferase